MSGDTTGQVLGATTSSAGVAMLPATGSNTILQILNIVMITAGFVVVLSFTASRIYRSFNR